jgi:hypothetical protein
LKDFPAACELEGLLIQYSYMSAIFWLNAMSHMMWTTFRKVRPVQISLGHDRKTGLRHPKYKWYALYSWGCPLLVSIVTLVMQHLPTNVTKYVTTPRIGQVNCFLPPDNAKLYYFHVINAPVMVIAKLTLMWYYCLAGKGTMDITHEWCPKITSGEATSDFGTTSV